MEKDHSIETLRGLAIILVVGFHITNDGPIAPAQDVYDYLGYSFQNIRLPLFTIISGYLYGVRPVVGPGYYGGFVQGKVRRILLPLVVVASLQFLAKAVLPGVNNPEPIHDLWKAFLLPYEHFWFLQVIFLLFLFVGVLGHLKILPYFRNWLILIAASFIVYLVYPWSNVSLKFFSLGATTYLLPYFLLGYGIAVHGDRILRSAPLYGWVALFLMAFGYQQYLWFEGSVDEASKRTVLGLAVSLSAAAILFRFRIPVWGLAGIGSYAYTIYLYQGFGTSFGRRVFGVLPDVGPHVYFIGMVCIAVGFGIAAEIVIGRIPYLRTLFLGLR